MLKTELSLLLVGHIACGVAAIVAGVAALASRKGSRTHRGAGRVFVASMLVGAGTAAVLGYIADPQDMADVISGVLTVYLVATAWVAATRADRETGRFEQAAFVIAATGSAVGFVHTTVSVQAGTALLGGVPGYVFASVAGLAALLDLSVIVRGGLAGRQRVARHLWRMLLGFFIAVGAFFPGQLHLFPARVQDVEPVILLFLPAFTIIAAMLFWLARVLWTGWFNAASAR